MSEHMRDEQKKFFDKIRVDRPPASPKKTKTEAGRARMIDFFFPVLWLPEFVVIAGRVYGVNEETLWKTYQYVYEEMYSLTADYYLAGVKVQILKHHDAFVVDHNESFDLWLNIEAKIRHFNGPLGDLGSKNGEMSWTVPMPVPSGEQYTVSDEWTQYLINAVFNAFTDTPRMKRLRSQQDQRWRYGIKKPSEESKVFGDVGCLRLLGEYFDPNAKNAFIMFNAFWIIAGDDHETVCLESFRHDRT